MHHFVAGAAGFIGSHLADSLLGSGYTVSGIDDFSLGRRSNLDLAVASGRFRIETGDCSDTNTLLRQMRSLVEWGGPIDTIWHMAANSDIALGVESPIVDFSRTLKTTFALLCAAPELGIRKFAFASSSAVYGERDDLLTEDSGPLLPISNYGAAKLGSEAFISASAESAIERAWIFRFPNVVGARATHGVILDFIEKLRVDPGVLRVLGNGTQRKPYLHVDELVDAMRFIVGTAAAKRNVFNIGPDGEGTTVEYIARKVVEVVCPAAAIEYGSADRGWIGDVPRFSYSPRRLKDLGWQPRLTSDGAVDIAVRELAVVRAR